MSDVEGDDVPSAAAAPGAAMDINAAIQVGDQSWVFF